MGKEPLPAAVTPEHFQTHQGFVACLTAELSGPFEAALGLPAGCFDRTAANRFAASPSGATTDVATMALAAGRTARRVAGLSRIDPRRCAARWQRGRLCPLRTKTPSPPSLSSPNTHDAQRQARPTQCFQKMNPLPSTAKTQFIKRAQFLVKDSGHPPQRSFVIIFCRERGELWKPSNGIHGQWRGREAGVSPKFQ